MMSISKTVLTDANFFVEVASGSTPSVAFFAAEWSAGCFMIEPIILKLSRKFAGRIRFCRVDADKAGDVAHTFGIVEFPTLLFFADGQPQARIDGIASESEISGMIESLL